MTRNPGQRVLAARVAAALVLVAGGAVAAHADESNGSVTERPSDLSAALAPLVAEAGGGSARVPERGTAGLRCWFGAEPREKDPFETFARPVTNLQFHHPFIWNELRPMYVYHWFPETSFVKGGRLKAAAFQIHLALTDDVQLTAYKDGYVDVDSDLLPETRGLADFAVGLKYNVWKDLEAPATFTIGAAYELKSGDEEVLEGETTLWDVFGSYARTIGPFNLITTAGAILPSDSDEAVRIYHWHVHLDMPVSDSFSPLVEVNGFHYASNAERNAGLGPTVPLGAEAFDYTNLGSDNVKGNDVITGALGFRWFLSDDVSLGAAWEVSLSDREDLIDKRLTVDLVLRF